MFYAREGREPWLNKLNRGQCAAARDYHDDDDDDDDNHPSAFVPRVRIRVFGKERRLLIDVRDLPPGNES
jgi:hypothetical protein